MKTTRALCSCHTPNGAQLVLHEHDGHYFLRIDGVQLMSTTASASEQTMAELACNGLPAAKQRILIGGLGFGFTLRRVLECCAADAIIDVAELLSEVITWNRAHLQSVNGLLLDDPRVRIHLSDVYELLDGKQRYDAILLDVDNSPDALVQTGNARLYNHGGMQRVMAALQPKGRVVYWSAHRDRSFAKVLGRVFKQVECVDAKAYPKAKRFTHTLFVADRD